MSNPEPEAARTRTRERRVARRLAITSLLVAAATAGSALLGVSMASAATCSGASCNGLTPEATGCAADGRIIATEAIRSRSPVTDAPDGPVYGETQLWESPTCNTVWATASQPAGSGLELTAGITAPTAPDSIANNVTARSTTGTAVTSLMWSPTPASPNNYYAGAYGFVIGVDGASVDFPDPIGSPFVAR